MDAWTLNTKREKNNATIIVIVVRHCTGCCTGLELFDWLLVSCKIVNVSCNKCCNLT